MKIEVIKKETIKPSSPTPNHLRKLKLSLLDQFGPVYLSPILFFFPRTQFLNSDSSERSRILKQSLSVSLNHFYPLAGRINQDNFSIDCNDEGVEFVEARINCPLSKILADPDPRALKKLIPPETVATTREPSSWKQESSACPMQLLRMRRDDHRCVLFA